MIALYGEALGPVTGVLHVVAVARVGAGLRVMRIGPHSPKSEADFAALTLARARVEAIVISGSVLRAEPELRYDLDTWLCVLTRSGELPAAHPVWEGAARPLVYTGPDAPLALPDRVEVVRAARPTPRGAIRHLREDRGCAGVSVEAGPRVAVPLYDPPLAVDELMLSVFEGRLDPRAEGGAFLDEAAIEERMVRVASTRVEEPSGPWDFRRYVRR